MSNINGSDTGTQIDTDGDQNTWHKQMPLNSAVSDLLSLYSEEKDSWTVTKEGNTSNTTETFLPNFHTPLIKASELVNHPVPS